MSAEHDNSLVLGGHCFGGLVALEMASRLEAEGREVAAVILLETIYSSTGEETSPNKETDLESENTAQVRPKDAAEHIFRKTYEQLALLPSIVAERFGQVYWEQYGMSMYYRPQPIQADIVLLRTSTYSEELFLGLHGLSLGDFTEHTVPGDSVSMLSPPYVKVVGAKIDNALAPYERR